MIFLLALGKNRIKSAKNKYGNFARDVSKYVPRVG